MKRRVFCATLAALPFLAHTLALAASPHTTFDLEPRSINPRYLRLLVVLMCLGMLARYAVANGWFS